MFCGHKEQGTGGEPKVRNKRFLGPSARGIGKYMWSPVSTSYENWLGQSWCFVLVEGMMSTFPKKEMMSSSTGYHQGKGKNNRMDENEQGTSQ